MYFTIAVAFRSNKSSMTNKVLLNATCAQSIHKKRTSIPNYDSFCIENKCYELKAF